MGLSISELILLGLFIEAFPSAENKLTNKAICLIGFLLNFILLFTIKGGISVLNFIFLRMIMLTTFVQCLLELLVVDYMLGAVSGFGTFVVTFIYMNMMKNISTRKPREACTRYASQNRNNGFPHLFSAGEAHR